MKRNGLGVSIASVLVLCGLSVPARAHHSFAAAFDMNKPVEVHGVITQVRLENPHSWFFLDVRTPGGEVEKWAFEAGTPSGMIRNGFKPNLIKAGTEVTIKGFHAKDPSLVVAERGPSIDGPCAAARFGLHCATVI